MGVAWPSLGHVHAFEQSFVPPDEEDEEPPLEDDELELELELLWYAFSEPEATRLPVQA